VDAKSLVPYRQCSACRNLRLPMLAGAEMEPAKGKRLTAVSVGEQVEVPNFDEA